MTLLERTEGNQLGERYMVDTLEFEIEFGDKTKTIVINKPTDKVNTDADLYSSQVFAKLARTKDSDGNPAYMVRAQLDKYLQDINVYTKDDVIRLGEIGQEIKKFEEKLNEGGKKSEGREAAVNLRILRAEFVDLLQRKAKYDLNTIEHFCENARFKYLITKCIEFKGEGPIYNSVEDYESDDVIKHDISHVIEQLGALTSAYDPDIEKKLPENKFLIEYGFCDDDLNLIDPKSGKRVNVNGDLINDNGEIVNEQGDLIDSEGNLLEVKIGVFVDDDDEEEVEPKPKAPRRRSKKKKI